MAIEKDHTLIAFIHHQITLMVGVKRVCPYYVDLANEIIVRSFIMRVRISVTIGPYLQEIQA